MNHTDDQTCCLYVFLNPGGVEVLRLSQGSEYCWGYLDALSNTKLIGWEQYQHLSARLTELTGPEGTPRLEERH